MLENLKLEREKKCLDPGLSHIFLFYAKAQKGLLGFLKHGRSTEMMYKGEVNGFKKQH